MVRRAENLGLWRIMLAKAAYDIEALKRATYAMMHRVSIEIEIADNDYICLITPLSENEDLDSFQRDFLREVVDHDLRISIASETELIRNAILGLTFSRTGLQSE